MGIAVLRMADMSLSLRSRIVKILSLATGVQKDRNTLVTACSTSVSFAMHLPSFSTRSVLLENRGKMSFHKCSTMSPRRGVYLHTQSWRSVTQQTAGETNNK